MAGQAAQRQKKKRNLLTNPHKGLPKSPFVSESSPIEPTFTHDFMKKPKQKTVVRRTINGWCAELALHPQTLSKILARVPASGSKGRFKTYDLATVKRAVEKHDAGKRQRRGTSDDLLAQRIRSIELHNAISDGTLIEHDRVKSAISVLLARVDQLIEQKLVNEFPSSVAGCDVAQAVIFGKRLTSELLAEFATCRKAFSI